MDSTTAAYERLIARFTAWARSDDNLRAAFVIGSRARTDHPADEWSDLDVVMLADDPMPYIDTTEWLHHIGTPWLTFIEPTPVDDGFERRVLFDGGLDVDFAPSPVAEFRQMVRDGLPAYLVDMLRRGVRVLIDKDGDARTLTVPEIRPTPTPPAESEFLNLVNDFWYHTVYTAKHLRRGELWWAKGCCDSYLKQLLLRMLEWHTQARHGDEIDTWMRGRFLEEWADQSAVAALPGVFARYVAEEVWHALFATMEMFGWLARETAEARGYVYPTAGEGYAADLVRRLFDTRTDA